MSGICSIVRQAAKDTLGITDGFSCRTQIAQGSNRHSLHLSELLLAARILSRRV